MTEPHVVDDGGDLTIHDAHGQVICPVCRCPFHPDEWTVRHECRGPVLHDNCCEDKGACAPVPDE